MSETVLFDAPGPKAVRRHRWIALIGGLVLLAGTAFVLAGLGGRGNLDADKWRPFLGLPVGTIPGNVWTDYLLPGLGNTLKAAGLAIVLSGIFGLAFGIGRLSPLAPVRWFSTAVVEFFRAVPLLVMMIAAFAYFAANNIFDSDTNPFAAVVTGLTLYNGAVVAELIRSGVHSLPAGQAEAGLSLGLTGGQTLRAIQLPQAIIAMVPALVSQLIVVLKDTALGQIITYPELLNTFGQIGSNWSNIVPTMIVIAAIFIAINYGLTLLARYAERWLRSRGAVTVNRGPGPGLVGLGALDAE